MSEARATRLARVEINVSALEPMTEFYHRALGFEPHGAPAEDAALSAACNQAVWRQSLRLGAQEIALTRFARPGRPISPTMAGDTGFQHVAVVVTDMAAAHARLRDWPAAPITHDGPQRLPDEAGAVTAYKFRDPEGHPLELLAFPPDRVPAAWRGISERLHLGYDHSAIAVADAARSIAFYAGFGFATQARQMNHGPAQARLDGVVESRVEVVALAPAQGATPHLELLAYHAPAPRTAGQRDYADLAATRLVLQAPDLSPDLLRDPDGHVIRLENNGIKKFQNRIHASETS